NIQLRLMFIALESYSLS
ncbi:Protein kinase domain-containing protein, partial [Psidium guajava]